jgi:hypothetical protein
MKLNCLVLVVLAFSAAAVSDEKVKAKKTYVFDGSKYKKNQNKQTSKQESKFKCDKRKYCSQMKSYEEALFFINHCPNVKMDGDNDGIPCERQFRKN